MGSSVVTTLVGSVDNREAVHVGAGGGWELSVPSSQFFCEPEIALKNRMFCFFKGHLHCP